MASLDLIIRGGKVADGSGNAIFSADIGVSEGKIVEVGSVASPAKREINADGALVTPGFVDTHSHYDGQILWDKRVWSSSLHGTTTVVNGNCGVGFAPVKSRDHKFLMELMESIEEIPERSLEAGIEWKWNDFGEFMDSVGPHDIDVAVMVAHNPLRLFVMGERALNGSPATSDDLERMRQIMGAAMDCGAAGFSTSRSRTHRTKTGDPVPARYAEKEELVAIANGMAGRGMFQIAAGGSTDDERRKEREIELAVAATGVSLVVPVVAGGDGVSVPVNAWRGRMGELDQITATGHTVWAQVAPRPVGVLLGLQATMNPFSGIPDYEAIAHLSLADRLASMRDSGLRKKLLDGVGRERMSGKGFQGVLRIEAFDQMWEITDPPMYEPHPDDSIASRAMRLGCRPEVLAYDILTADQGQRLIYFAFFGYADFNLDSTRQLLLHDRAVVGLGDGGAHVASVIDSSYPTTMLAYWGRDRTRGERLDLPWIVQSLSSRPAGMAGFHDRGLIAPGYKADLNIIDFENLRMGMPRFVHDLPAGERRLVQGAEGILATFVAGEMVYQNGQHTGALPGRMLRSSR